MLKKASFTGPMLSRTGRRRRAGERQAAEAGRPQWLRGPRRFVYCILCPVAGCPTCPWITGWTTPGHGSRSPYRPWHAWQCSDFEQHRFLAVQQA